MYQVISQNTFLSEILGSEEYSPECVYQSSMFNVVIPCDNRLLIYNTLSKLFVVTEKKYGDLFCGHIVGAPNTQAAPADLSFFIGSRIWVSTAVDELHLYEEVHSLIRTMEDDKEGLDRYNILTTTGCNARCFYCFEEGIHAVSMTHKVAEKVVGYIDKTRNRNKPILLRWFGGEPLVNVKVINYISMRLKSLKIDFKASMSSNGYLFDDKIVEKASSFWNLSKVRISFDGMEEEHNRRKNYYKKGNSFSRTVENIDKLIHAGIQVDIRLTLDNDNKNDIYEVANYLTGRYSGSLYVKIYTRCIFEETTSAAAEKDYGRVIGLVDFKEKIDDFLRDRKMFDYERLLPIGYQPYYCAANDPHKVVIAPDGSLCCCETIDKNTRFWGDVVNGINNPDYRGEWLECNTATDKCLSCRFLPSCTPFRKCPNDYFDCVGRCQTAYSTYLMNKYNECKETGILFG